RRYRGAAGLPTGTGPALYGGIRRDRRCGIDRAAHCRTGGRGMTTVAADTAAAVTVRTAPKPAKAPGRRRGAPVRIIAQVVVFVVVMAGWYFASHYLIAAESRFLLPGPDEVIAEGLLDSAVRAEILSALGSTVLVALSGLVVAMVLGVGFAAVMSQARWAEYSLYPYAVILQTIPILAVVPLFGFW